MSSAKEVLVHFFREQKIRVLSVHLERDTLEEILSKHFNQFTDGTMREIINQAIKHRTENAKSGASGQQVLGVWSEIIDAMKAVIERKRDEAASHFQQLLAIGEEGNATPLDTFLVKIHKRGSVDYLFIDLLNEAMTISKKNKQEDLYYMMMYSLQTIDALKAEEEDANNNTVPSSSSAKSRNNPELYQVDSTSKGSSNSLSEHEEMLVEYTELLKTLVEESNGDVQLLKRKILTKITNKELRPALFLETLKENIIVCERVGYHIKVKLFKHLQTFIEQEIQKAEEINAQLSQGESLAERDENGELIVPQILSNQSSNYHAPQFVGPEKDENNGRTITSIVADDTLLIDGMKADILAKPKNNKKKALKKQNKLRVSSLAHQISEHLDLHGWAAINHFLPLDLIRRVRVESAVFREYYESAEIWVGKRADIGAHLTVPSVRGDKVLWLCGGHRVFKEDGDGKAVNHMAVEGVTRAVKTHGDIEPCKLSIRAAAPLRRFHAIKEIVLAVDKLVDELRETNPKLRNIYERSDAMLAVYPGEGARFARHIDNTTSDGRRLTVLIYLNPQWRVEDGGAIRLTEIPKNENNDAAENKDHSSIDYNAGQTIDIYPEAARVLMFFSSEIPHEVLPTYADRHSMTIWYYDSEERREAVERAKSTENVVKVSQTTAQQQREAQEFMAELMGRDETAVDGHVDDVSQLAEELERLKLRVSQLSDKVLEIVASITGSPSVAAFRQGFPMLSVQDLQSMRKLFRNMGLH